MRQVKFHNKTVPIGRCKIGVVVSNIEGTHYGHIMGFKDSHSIFVQWESREFITLETEIEDIVDLIIWE